MMNQCFKGVKKSVVCAREGGANTTPLFPAAHFAKQNTKFGGGESEGEAGIHFPQAPFSARLARAKSFVSAARSAAISQYFIQKRFALRSVIATSLLLSFSQNKISDEVNQAEASYRDNQIIRVIVKI